MTYPLPRLRCIRPGESFILRGETRLRTLIETDDRYGYHEDGYASLCHQLSPEALVWAAGGWQPELRRKYETEAATLELAGA